MELASISRSAHRQSSAHFKTASMHWETPTCAPPGLSEVSQTMPLKQFQCSPKMAFTCPFKKDLRALVLCKPKASFQRSHGGERRSKINRHTEEKGVQRSRAWLFRLKGREKDVVDQTNTRTVSTATPGTR